MVSRSEDWKVLVKWASDVISLDDIKAALNWAPKKGDAVAWVEVDAEDNETVEYGIMERELPHGLSADSPIKVRPAYISSRGSLIATPNSPESDISISAIRQPAAHTEEGGRSTAEALKILRPN